MFGFFTAKRKKATLALDIGTEWIKALLFLPGEPGEVLAYNKTRQKLGEMYGGAVTDIVSVTENCKKIVDDLERETGARATDVALGIAGELVRGITETEHYERKNPEEPITLAELKEMVQNMQNKAYSSTREELASETGVNEIDVKLVNAAVVEMRIDGYRVTNPLGFKGRDVQMSVFNAFAPLTHLASMQSIADALNLNLVSVIVEPYAVSRAMSHEDAGAFSAIFIDIGGGTTDIAIVQNGGCLGVKMFAVGGRAFTKRIAMTMGCGFLEAEKLKIAYSNAELDRTSMRKIHECVNQDIETWLSGIELLLGEFEYLETMPSKILLCGGGALLPDIRGGLENHKWSKNLPFGKEKLAVLELKPEDIKSIKHNLKTIQDVTPLALANLAQKITLEETVMDRVLSRAVKMLR